MKSVILTKDPSAKQFEQLADILSDIALLTTASTIVPSILLKFEPISFTFGIIISVILWLYSIKIS